jgi:hypothetical protein
MCVFERGREKKRERTIHHAQTRAQDRHERDARRRDALDVVGVAQLRFILHRGAGQYVCCAGLVDDVPRVI